jgi:hypothetical protein
MRPTCISVVLALGMFFISGRVCAQSSISNSFPWPANPNVGIGTQLSAGGIQNALQIHYNSTDGYSKPPILRLSVGTYDTTGDYGILGLMPTLTDMMYSSLSRSYDLILHDHQDGDIIVTNLSRRSATHQLGGAIRFATAGDSLPQPIPLPGDIDLERLTINGNGNIGIDMPPWSSTGLDTAVDQLQVGGGSAITLGEVDPLPGLTFYGGNRFEGMLQTGGGMYPVDLRYIGFNYGINHTDSSSSRTFRMARTSSSVISFGDGDGASIDLGCYPYNSDSGTNYFKRAIHFHFMGSKGLELYKDVSDSDQNHHLFDCWVPGFPGYNWMIGGDSLRNVNGLFIHYTPVLISETGNWDVPNFTNLTNVKPDMGDDSTWLLAVNGPALFKEVYVDDTDWPDYVFDPGYKLPSLGEVENFFRTNRHLPDIPSANKIDSTGIPLGRTEAAITKQLEETLLYVTQLSHKIETLESEVEELKNQKEK